MLRLHQVHGAQVVVVEYPRAQPAGRGDEHGDALVGSGPGMVLSVLTADCAPVALASPSGFAAVHAGWRGIVAGVVPRSAAALGALGPGPLHAGIGPTIGPCCYAFSPGDLDVVAAAAGPAVRAVTSEGAPSLDLRAAVRAGLAAAGVTSVWEHPACTSCSGLDFSHRARRDEARQALFVWRDRSGR